MRGVTRAWLWGPVAAYAALIFYLSSQSSFPVPARVWDFDKCLHFIEYGGLCFLLCRAFTGSGVALNRTVAFSFLTTVAYGVSDEYHQSFVPGRDSSVFDATADAVGAAMMVGLWFWYQTSRRRKS